ncbi:MAG: hypothetical protein KDA27_02340 [Candidatus Eisenbacteria bacterium]|uniref:GS catalytic domain-containing protein n=1 Tax=Eiseniibacteriota bacterium TaxID=2212470 RepID=A0A956N8M1_UNCEI|nr:hypothetical protein [Candidatus Eisenbacteria bacterium]
MSPVDMKAQYVAEPLGGELAVKIGKPAAEWTEDDIVGLVAQGGIRVVSLMHVDGEGELRALDFLPRSEAHLREILRAGERADGSSLFPGAGLPPDASDIVLRPRLASAFIDPFSEIPTLVLMAGHQSRDGAPLPQSPDTIVRRAAAHFHATTGAELLAHAEVEFFLGKPAEEADVYGSSDRGYHATSPFVFGEDIRRQAMVLLGDLGVAVKYGHAEVGYIGAEEGGGYIWEQHEIELALAPLPVAAEAVVLTQWVLRNLAHASGVQCSFRPVLRAGHAGSGMHFHFAALSDDGFATMDGPAAELARSLVGGLVRSGGALMAFGNRSRESFLRLQQGKEVPASITWGHFNRKALVRIPVLARTADGEPVAPPTVEFRLPDGSVNPFLLLAGAAQAVAHASGDASIEETLRDSRAGTPNGALSSAKAQSVSSTAEASAGAEAKDANVTARSLPLSFDAIADALELERSALGADDVFPAELLDATLSQLRSGGAN